MTDPQIYETIAGIAIKQAKGNARELRKRIYAFEKADGFTPEGRAIILKFLREALLDTEWPQERERGP